MLAGAWLVSAALCSAASIAAEPAPVADLTASAPPASAAYRNPALPVEQRVDDLLARMTLAEKIGQMTQAERFAVDAATAGQRLLGSVLSGGGSSPLPNAPASWVEMIDGYQKAAAATRLGIPILYGIDAVHGHQSVKGATLFPHLLGLAATRDEALVRRVGEITAREMAATGIYWNFSPMVSVTQDLRWGRTHESFGEDGALVSALGRAYSQGLMTPLAANAPRVMPTAKHFIGDGGTAWVGPRSTAPNANYPIDQGDTKGDTDALLARYLPPYKAQFDAGVMSVMASFSSWNGTKLHAEKHLLTEVLKGRLGFQGFVVSDWDAIQLLPGSFREQVAAAVNAGIDMAMVPKKSAEFIAALTEAVKAHEVEQVRIDDATRRILRAKFAMGLFEQSRALPALLPEFGSPAHRAVAREAVAQSLTLLKNAKGTLPLRKGATVLVAGALADDLGAQSGGWTLEWQGVRGNKHFPGTSVLAAIQQAAGAEVRFDALGKFSGKADVGIAVVGETPYAEGVGDREIGELALSREDAAAVEALRPRVDKLVLLVIAGRPLLLGESHQRADAVVMAYQPGSEGAGITDVLWGDKPFRGRLPMGWPRTAEGYRRADVSTSERCASLQWAVGFGLTSEGRQIGSAACPLKP